MSALGFIHRYEPPREGSRRTLLVLHGTGGDENDMLAVADQIDRNAGILSPRGKVLEAGMPRFFRRHAEGVFDEEDLKFRTDELVEFVAGASVEYGFDASQVIAVGYSNGANIAASTLFRAPSTLAGAVLLHAMVPFTPEQEPDLSGKPVFMSAGENDPIVPAAQVARLSEMLRRYGANVQIAWFQAGHRLTLDEVRAATDWMKGL